MNGLSPLQPGSAARRTRPVWYAFSTAARPMLDLSTTAAMNLRSSTRPPCPISGVLSR